MSLSLQRPAWVIGPCIDVKMMDCCGNEEPFPFKCAKCENPLLLCLECDAQFSNLRGINKPVRTTSTGERCPHCNAMFEIAFWRSPQYRVSFEEWLDAGLKYLLVEKSIQELNAILIDSAEFLSNSLQRGMRSTARTRLAAYQNLAEAIAIHHPSALHMREEGSRKEKCGTLNEAMAWHATIADPISRAYALLGIAEAFASSTHS